MLNESISADGDFIEFNDEVDDDEVSHMLELIFYDFPFEPNSWRGGVKADDLVVDP